MKCKRGFEIKVCKSNLVYLGTTDEDGFPNCRCSDYFKDEKAAQFALENGFEERRCMENSFCNGYMGCFEYKDDDKQLITIPKAGDPATEHLFSDSHACTISKVSPSGKTIWYKRDNAKVVSGSCQDGSAVYDYTPDEGGYEHKATLRKDGRYKEVGTNFTIFLGRKIEYYDPHF